MANTPRIYCDYVFIKGKKRDTVCGKYCRKDRGNNKCYDHSPKMPISKYVLKDGDYRKNGMVYCCHNKRRAYCIDCGGSCMCIHRRQTSNCRECNFNGYIAHILTDRIYQAMVRFDEKGGIAHLGCNVQEFLVHINNQLESQIVPDDRVAMDWDNYNIIWEFDHIIPILHGNFKNLTVETVLNRLHYTNIQPLYIDLNQKKGNRL